MVLMYWGVNSVWALVGIGLILLLAVILGIQAHRMRVLGGNEELPGMRGEVTEASDARGYAYALVRGEIWRIRSSDRLTPGDWVRVRKVRGLTLDVERLEGPATMLDDESSTIQGGKA